MVKSNCWKSVAGAILSIGLCCLVQPLFAQTIVDCSNQTPWANFTSISSALANTGDGANIIVMPGGCSEDININGLSNVSIGALYGNRVALNGSFTINGSRNILLYGFDVSSPNNGGAHPNGIQVSNSQNVMMDACTSKYNQGQGLHVENSSAHVQAWGVFDNNGGIGVNVSGHSYLSFLGWAGNIDVSSNQNAGVYVERSQVDILGPVFIMDNRSTAGVGFPSGFGIDMRGAATATVFGIFGQNMIFNNRGGGISLQENSEISVGGNVSWAAYSDIIQANGPVGISAGFGAQLTLFGGVQVLGHTTAGIDVFGNSQAAIYLGSNVISQNGFGTDPARAGIRVDGNSEAYLRNAVISQNGGPGVLALINSSVDSFGSTFSSNAGGSFACDTSATVTGDMTASSLGSANLCKAPGNSGSQHRFPGMTKAPDWHSQKAIADRFKALCATIRH